MHVPKGQQADGQDSNHDTKSDFSWSAQSLRTPLLSSRSPFVAGGLWNDRPLLKSRGGTILIRKECLWNPCDRFRPPPWIGPRQPIKGGRRGRRSQRVCFLIGRSRRRLG